MALIERTVHDIVPSIDPRHDLRDAAKGKIVLITGAGSGTGKAMARQYAIAGATQIVIAGRTASTLEKTKAEVEALVPGCTVTAIPTDVTKDDAVEALFARLPGVPDILINNSGTVLNQRQVADSDPLEWWADVEVSLKGAYLCTRAYLRLLLPAGRPGTVLNVSSGAADDVSNTMSAYGTAKCALNRLTEMVHFEYAGRGVRCIAFAPGSIRDTGIGARAPPQFQHILHDTVDMAGGFAVWLGTEAAAFLAGRYVVANWDVARIAAMKDEILDQNLLISRVRYGTHFSTNIVLAKDDKA